MWVKKYLLSVFFTVTVCSCFAIKDLMRDMQFYKSNQKQNYYHSGDVYEHSIWVLRTVATWLQNRERPWAEGVDIKKYKKTLILAAFLHDIGKCGDNIFDWRGKTDHPEKGFEYLTGRKPYLSQNIPELNNLDFKKIGQEFGLSDNDMKLVAILVRMHYKFGNVMRKSISPAKYIEILKNTAEQINYPMSQVVVKMCILISVADVKGLGYLVGYKTGEQAWDPIPYYPGMFKGVKFFHEWTCEIVAPHPAAKDGWSDWEYQIKAPAVRSGILKMYNALCYTKNQNKLVGTF